MTGDWSSTHLRLGIEAAGVALWSWNVDDDTFKMDARGFELWGLSQSDTLTFGVLSEKVFPADRDHVHAAFEATRSVEGPYEIDFRIMLGEEIRWISARGQGADAGIVDHMTFGVFIDVTDRKQAEEGNELLAGEMSHRVKNLIAIASSLTTFASRSSKNVEYMAQDLTRRLFALDRAHDLVRPLPDCQGSSALLGDLLSVLLTPYDDQDASGGRICVAVPRIGVGQSTATALAMVMHELATNSAKYGALSAETGALDISGKGGEKTLTLVWSETGGPAISETPELNGFGSRMIMRNLNALGGKIEYDWQESGLVATLTMNSAALSH